MHKNNHIYSERKKLLNECIIKLINNTQFNKPIFLPISKVLQT